ncbi:diaminopimelate decarboxylase [Kordiimonas sediminis]|uniref:Diaminopimelate decarboxylase n=1 Tax=Kordiimonas sediminis TaxID=1735581 RepID=A0A919E4L3_9PROT|nr:diaminopimelate decarboxylase [Kordiimonas sediminis]GHF11687.1 diaminopimelate decarboxylase [Kordiimonas sediminis]
MDHFTYKNDILHAEDVALTTIAQAVGTPVYVYSHATLTRHYRVFRDAFKALNPLICFAVKANSNQAVLATLAREGAGADVVSKGELMRALRAGIPAEKIVFSGVGKTADEMEYALKAGIKQFNVESEPELEVLSAVATRMEQTAPVSIRVNPDVDAKTHAKISTGKAENKFGISWTRVDEIYAKIAALPGLVATGVDVHIGSQLTDLAPFREAFIRVVDLVKHLRANGHDIRHIDLGGGLGIPYVAEEKAPPLPAEYGQMVIDVLGDLDCELIFEPGRLIAGNAGVLLTEVIYRKEGEGKTFYIVDAAMNDLARPAMYDAHHDFFPVKRDTDAEMDVADFVGPICESGDTFAKGRKTPRLQGGDLMIMKSCGAYGAVMSSTYNTRPLVAEVMVKGDQYAVIRPRQSLEELISLDCLPHWEIVS